MHVFAGLSIEEAGEVLGIARNADGEEIRRSYRKLAMKYHPDRADGDKTVAETKFKVWGFEISNASLEFRVSNFSLRAQVAARLLGDEMFSREVSEKFKMSSITIRVINVIYTVFLGRGV